MGYACSFPVDEDTLCAEYIRNELTGLPNDFNKMIPVIRKGSGKRFFEPEKQEWAPASDFNMCLKLNLFDFILKVRNDNNPGFLEKIPVPAHI